MAGVDLATVAQLMGHKTIQMTMRYAHLAPNHLSNAVDCLVPTTGHAGKKQSTKSSTTRFEKLTATNCTELSVVE
jgi:hypothetical protein